jgi:membrane-bound serine protease (ClpP class)
VISGFLSPDLAFLLVIAGAFAIYWELLAPGMIVPGVFGLVLFVEGARTLSHDNPTWYGAALILLGLTLLALEIKAYTHMISGLAGTVALALGAMVLIRGPLAIAPSLALSLAVVFGATTIFLGRLAMRASHNKRMVGEEPVIDEIGCAQTDINPEGTVMVRGECWTARSPLSIPKGERIYVTEVRGMELEVMPLSRPVPYVSTAC